MDTEDIVHFLPAEELFEKAKKEFLGGNGSIKLL